MAKQSAQDTPTTLQLALKEARPAFVVVAVFSFFLNLLYLVSPLYMLQVYDRVLTSGSRETLLYLTLIALAALVVFGLLEAVRTSLLARMGRWLHERCGPDLLRASLEVSVKGRSVGAQPLRDFQQVQSFVGGASLNPFFDAPWVPVFIGCLWVLHPWLGLLGLVSAVVMLVVALVNELVTRKPLKESSGASVAAHDEADRVASQYETVYALGMFDHLAQRWQRTATAAQERGQTASELGGSLTGLSRFLRMGVQVGVLGAGALLVLLNEMTAGAMIAGSILLGRALAPIEQSLGAWKGFVSARVGYERLQALLREAAPQPEPMRLPDPEGRLIASSVFIKAAQSDQLILRNVSFRVEPGEAVAVIGPSASGKSTLCRAICGLMTPIKGSLRLDGAEISQWPRDQFSAAVGYLPQEVQLFPGSVKENIARMAADPPAEAVIAAARIADVHDLILGLPEGYDTRIGSGGHPLSGGQKQRVGLARAVYSNPRLVVLDEPNANLDQQGELALLAAMNGLKQAGVGIVLVAHRQAALEFVDKILVLKDGAVEIFDTRDAVLEVMRERRRFASRAGAERQAGPAGGAPA
ncbi:MAG: type I secretion system permease/ATPase [Oceanicaulis sp.]